MRMQRGVCNGRGHVLCDDRACFRCTYKFTRCASRLEQTRVEGYPIAPPFLPFSLSLSACLTVCVSICLSDCLSLSRALSISHSLTLSLPLSAFAPSLRLSQSLLSPLSLLPLTPPPLLLPPHYSIAPASRSTFAASALPFLTASCSGVFPSCGEGEAVSAQASCVPHATNSKAPPPPTLRRSRYLNCLLRWCCSALPPHALHPPPADPRLGVRGVGCGVRVQQLLVGV